MKISNRLTKIYEQVRHGESAADIGTDHGYVPIMLLYNGISPRVIMSDISERSIEKARMNFHSEGYRILSPEEILSDDPAQSVVGTISQSEFRVGNGLETISPSEVDTVIIAGMGGLLIRNILSADISKSFSFKKFILQPRNNAGILRHWLLTNGFDIGKEVLAEEGKFVCEIIVALPQIKFAEGKTDNTANAAMIKEHLLESFPHSDDIRWEYPYSLSKCNNKLLRKLVNRKIGSINIEIYNLGMSKDDQSERISGLKEDRNYLRQLLD